MSVESGDGRARETARASGEGLRAAEKETRQRTPLTPSHLFRLSPSPVSTPAFLTPAPPAVATRPTDTATTSVSSAALDAWAGPAGATDSTGTANAPQRPRPAQDPLSAALPPKRIPRVIHQTYRSAASLPPATARLMASWRARNPAWTVRFWDDAACAAFVGAEFPEYAAAYASLPKDVERSDFFRYLVVLRLGGLYADMDTECRTDLESLIAPGDTLVVGWENEFPSPARAAGRQYARTRQVLQWVFAGAPGHPALRAVCDHIASNANATLSRVANLDTLERTGPGAWTDAVLGVEEGGGGGGGGGREGDAEPASDIGAVLAQVLAAGGGEGGR